MRWLSARKPKNEPLKMENFFTSIFGKVFHFIL